MNRSRPLFRRAAPGFPRTRTVAVAGLLLSLPAAPAAAQESVEEEPVRFDTAPRLFTVDLTVSGVYDTNIDHDQDELESVGVLGGLRVGLRSSGRHPILRLEYRGDIQRFDGTDRWNRQTHGATGTLQGWFGPVTLASRGGVKFNAATEDREIGNRYSVSPRVEVEGGPLSLGLYGVYWTKRFEEDVEANEEIRGAGAELGWKVPDAGRWEIGYRYEEADSEAARRRFVRQRYSAEYRARLGARDVIELEVERRDRRFLDRTVRVDDLEVPTEDVRWLPAASYRHRFPWGQEVKLEYEFQRRRSNDPARDFDAHRGTLSLRLPLISPVRKRPRSS